jgi:TolB-like protein/Tfp pilus assembly protein PilF
VTSIFDELRRRNVFRALAIYAGAAWLLVQVATQVFPFFDVPNWAVRWVVIATLLGAPIVAVLAWFYEFTTDGLKRESQLDERADVHRRSLGLSGFAIIGVVAALTLAGLGVRYWNFASDQPLPSMAVMPFKHAGDNNDDAYFTDGIQDEIQTRLSKIAEFKVISRTSASYYAQQSADLHQIAQQLGITHVVEGSVQRHGGSARINVQLIATANDTQLWAETYDRQLTNVFDVESEVAKAIVDAMRAKLSPSEKRELATDPTQNSAAYDAYLRGMAANAHMLEAGSLAESARWFAKAVDLDPGFALAWARLARANAERAYYGMDLTERPCDQARHASENAWRLQPELGEIDLARGFVRFMCDNDLSGAEQAFVSARKRLPNDADVLRSISQIEWQRGNWKAVLSYLHDAEQLDPHNPELLGTYALYLGADRQFDQALAMSARALQITPDDATLKASSALLNQADGKLDVAQQQLSGMELQPKTAEVFAYQMLQLLYRGQYAQARDNLRSALLGDLSAMGVGIADYYSLLATSELALGDGVAAKQTFAKGYAALKPFDSGSITANSSAGIYLRLMLCVMAAGQDATGLQGSDCTATRDIARNNGQFSMMALEALAQADVLSGNKDAALTAITTLLDKSYISARYRTPLTASLLRNDPIWAPLRDDPRLQKLLARRRGG